MNDLYQETAAWTSLPTRDRLRALQRIIPRAQVEEVLAQTGQDRAVCKRLPGWFMVWFMIALGLCCCDGYRQIFRWLQPFRPGGVPGRSTLCEARKRLGTVFVKIDVVFFYSVCGRPETLSSTSAAGFSHTSVTGFQLRMAPCHRSGWRALACS